MPRSRSAAQEIAWSLLGAVALVLLTQVRIPLPFTPVPFTMQTLGVLLLGGVLGPVAGTLAVLEYLLMGACGLPVFSQGGAGLPWMLVTGGFLLAFGPAAFLFGALTQRVRALSYGARLAALLVGGVGAIALIYFGGWAWFASFTHKGLDVAFQLAVAPFILMDMVKVGAAAALLALRGQKEA
jgi:biotin transport system substrate-specific component